jgi:hypothetical protein
VLLRELQGRLNQAFVDAFSMNTPYFGGGGPGYYGVRLENVAVDGSEVDLVLTFRSGVRYCCFEPGCHFSYYSEGWWSWLRQCMDRNGLSHLPLPVIRRLHGVIEEGALFDTASASAGGEPRESRAYEYEDGPYHPVSGSSGQ